MTDSAERPNRFSWPPVIYPIALVAASLLAWLAPLPWIPSPVSDILLATGGLLVAGGVAIYAGALAALKRAKTTKDPTLPASTLVTDGPFKITRNPIYLGATTVLIGIGLVAGSWYFLGAALIAASATWKLAIEGEERHLAARFGKRYRDYSRRVRRWI